MMKTETRRAKWKISKIVWKFAKKREKRQSPFKMKFLTSVNLLTWRKLYLEPVTTTSRDKFTDWSSLKQNLKNNETECTGGENKHIANNHRNSINHTKDEWNWIHFNFIQYFPITRKAVRYSKIDKIENFTKLFNTTYVLLQLRIIIST